MSNNISHAQELYRAQAIIAKAERNGENVGPSLREHMVSQSIIKELVGEVYEYIPKARKQPTSASVLETWTKEHIGIDITPTVLSEQTKLSYNVVTKFMRERRDLFHKVKKGYYFVRDVEAERKNV